jgi:hypothetical protein
LPRLNSDALPSIDICDLRTEGRLSALGKCFCLPLTPYGQVLASSGENQLFLLEASSSKGLDLWPVVQRVQVAWTPCRYGGRRPWFLCPVTSCGRKCDKIYLKGGFFACRKCHRLAYASQREPVRQRGLHKARKIRDSLGGSANVFEAFPGRPKGMHQASYRRLRVSHDQAVDRCMAGLSKIASRLGSA